MVLASTTKKNYPVSRQDRMDSLAIFIALGPIRVYSSSDRCYSGNRMACARRHRSSPICGYLPLCSVETRILLRNLQAHSNGDLVAFASSPWHPSIKLRAVRPGAPLMPGPKSGIRMNRVGSQCEADVGQRVHWKDRSETMQRSLIPESQSFDGSPEMDVGKLAGGMTTARSEVRYIKIHPRPTTGMSPRKSGSLANTKHTLERIRLEWIQGGQYAGTPRNRFL